MEAAIADHHLKILVGCHADPLNLIFFKAQTLSDHCNETSTSPHRANVPVCSCWQGTVFFAKAMTALARGYFIEH